MWNVYTVMSIDVKYSKLFVSKHIKKNKNIYMGYQLL